MSSADTRIATSASLTTADVTTEAGTSQFSARFSDTEHDERTTQKVGTATNITSTAASTTREEHSTLKETLSAERNATTQQPNTSTKQPTIVQTEFSNLTSVGVTLDARTTTSALITERDMTTVSAMSYIDKSDFFLQFCIISYLMASSGMSVNF